MAELFPLMQDDDLAALAANIREHGLLNPIIFCEGKILDGRNRWRACEIAGVEPRTQHFPADGDPLAFVLSANLHRRHLTTSQRALLAARIANLPHGRPGKEKGSNSTLFSSIDDVADKLSVGRTIVKEARTVLQDPVLTRAVEAGERSIHAAATAMKTAPAFKPSPAPCDYAGHEIPKALWSLWDRRSEVETILTRLKQAHEAMQAARENNDILFAPIDFKAVFAHLEGACGAIGISALYALCPTCDGLDVATCATCQGRGFLTEDAFDRCPAPRRHRGAKN